MSTINKSFKVKNGLEVTGTASFNSDVVINNVPLAFDSNTNRLKLYVDGAWVQVALLSDADLLSFNDIGLAIDYDGELTYILQANGVTPTGVNKFVDNGNPSTSTYYTIFDGGTIN